MHILGMGRYTYLPIRYYPDTWVPIRYVLRFIYFFKIFDSTSIAIQYCCCNFYFLFLNLDHGEKLNDTLNIQTATIKTPILAVIFLVLFQLSVNTNKQSQKFQ